MKVGVIGLGNIGAKLADNLRSGGIDLAVHDLDDARMASFAARGARTGARRALVESEDVILTCLPSPAASAQVIEALAPWWRPGLIWMEMSTTDATEMRRLAALIEARGGIVAECPVSGGCHRAATGNISVFMGGTRAAFDLVLPLLKIIGRQILHTGPLGSASVLKVMTNYLATTHLVALCEALTVMKSAGLDLATTYEAIRISSGNSFVHETESQMILSGSRDIEFTMDLVLKDVGLFQQIAENHAVALDLSPLVIDIFRDGQRAYGSRAKSDDIIRRLEDRTGLDITAPGFPARISDPEPPAEGAEVVVRR
jgi:3-hydroxyisobutyrate dehydrogenase